MMSLKAHFLPSFSERKTMQKKLFGYMLILVAILLCLLSSFLFLFGRLEGTEEEVFRTLALQQEVFDREMSTYYESIAARSISLSKSATATTDKYLKEEHLSFPNLDNSVERIENLEAEYMDLLVRELLKVDCSGAFIVLDTSRTTANEESKAGVYIQRDMLGSNKQDAMLLYRGTASIGKEKGIMPHRKWKLEFSKSQIPSFEEIFYSPKAELEYACHITDVAVLPGMSEKVMLIAVPIRTASGKTIGICGFEVSETLFKLSHAQPTTLDHLTCVFSRKNGHTIDCEEGFACGIENGYFWPAKGKLFVKTFGKHLKLLTNEYGSFIGLTTDMPLCIENNEYEITVMIPRTDYVNQLIMEIVQIILIVLLSGFAALILCLYFSRKYIAPVLKGLNKLRQSEPDDERSDIAEIDELFDYLAEKFKAYQRSIDDLHKKNEKAQSTIEKLSYDRKKEVSPDDYAYFYSGLKTLTPAEKNIFNMYLSGKSIRQIAEENGIKEATVKFHNHNIYDKLGVTSKKELLRFAAIYLQENE